MVICNRIRLVYLRKTNCFLCLSMLSYVRVFCLVLSCTVSWKDFICFQETCNIFLPHCTKFCLRKRYLHLPVLCMLRNVHWNWRFQSVYPKKIPNLYDINTRSSGHPLMLHYCAGAVPSPAWNMGQAPICRSSMSKKIRWKYCERSWRNRKLQVFAFKMWPSGEYLRTIPGHVKCLRPLRGSF